MVNLVTEEEGGKGRGVGTHGREWTECKKSGERQEGDRMDWMWFDHIY